MDKMTFLDTVYRWSAQFVKGCLSRNEHICISAALYVLSAFMLLVSCSLLLYHRCKTRGRSWADEAVCALYCFVGNLCSAVGAFLSNQFDFQISMASYMAILDVIHFLSISFSVYLWYRSKMGKKMRMMSRRRGQNFLAVSLLFVMCGSVYFGLPVHSSPVRVSPTMRRMFGIFLNDHSEDLGYLLGLLFFAISWTAKFPFILKANRGEQISAVHVFSRVLSSAAGALYASAILLYDTQLRSVIKAMPWILSAICCAVLDFLILLLICYRSSHKRPSVRSLDSDNESLLGDSAVTGQLCYNNLECCRKKHRLPSARGISPKGTDMGLYMDVNIQPMRKVCLKEVTISRDGSSESLPLKRTVRVVRVDEQCSSSSSTDSSSLGSELEWDFEETKTQWIPVEDAPNDEQKGEVVPLQERPVSLKSSGRPGSHVCFCSRAQLAEKMASK